MKFIVVNDFLEFIKQKYNIFFILLLVYIIRVEIEYGYFFMVFDILFYNNPLSSFLLTIFTPSELKLAEIWFKFNFTFIATYIFYYSFIEKPKNLREFLIIKRNFAYYPLIFIYTILFLFVYQILLKIQTGNPDAQSEISFLQAFIVIEIITYVLFVYKFMDFIDRKWNLTTQKELNIYNKKQFDSDQDFVVGLSASFKTTEEWDKAKELNLNYPFEFKYYEEMKKGNFPDINEYFNASYWNIDNYEDWLKSSKYRKKVKTKKQYKETRNIFDMTKYLKYTIKSKFNIFFLLWLAASVIDYNLFINSFYSGQNYVSKLTYTYFANRWIIFYGVFFIAYFIYFFIYKKPDRIVEEAFIKLNMIVYPIIFLIVTILRLEIFTSGTPQYYMNLSTRILQNVIQPFVGSGAIILLMFSPLVFFVIFRFKIVSEYQYFEFIEGNFVSYNSYKIGKSLDVLVNPDYTYLLSMQPYINKDNIN